MAVVVYGNRDYDDALLELTDLLRENGFYIAGAAAMIAEHSIFPQVAAGRPDQSDMEKIAGFVSDCTAVINLLQEDLSEEKDSIAVKGNIPYKDPAPVPVKPQVSKLCNNCGICGTLCPACAIDKANGTCIKNCPQKARSFGGPIYAAGAMMFKKQCSARREPEFFL